MDKKFAQDLSEISSDMKILRSKSENRLKFDFEKYPLIHNQALYAMSMSKGEIVFQKNIEEILGYKEGEFTFESAFTLVHPEDYPAVKRIVKATMEFSKENGMRDDAVLFLTYRMRKKDGTYIKVQRTSGISQVKYRRLESHYSVIQDISYMNLSNIVRWHWDSPTVDKEKFLQFVKVAPGDFFTPREMDIFRLIKQGARNREIAKILGISYNTVITHRKNLLKKSSCRNVFELLQYFNQEEMDPLD